MRNALTDAGHTQTEIAKRIGEYMSACQLGITLASLGLGWIGEPAFASLVGRFERGRLSRRQLIEGLSLLAASLVTFGLFAAWQLAIPSPIVDLRTTLRAPVLLTNLSSICMGFSLFALSLIAPQILELPAATGYGLGQSLTSTGLWLAPGGLAMMMCASASAVLAARRGPKFTLVLGSAIIALGYLVGPWLIGSAALIGLLNVILSIGVGFGFAALPTLINAAVPITETAAANGINALARSLGTSLSSAVMGAIMAAMVVVVPGIDGAVPSQAAFQVAMYVAGAVALLGALLAALMPDPVAALRA